MSVREPMIIGFLCNWCSYAGADLAGVLRTQYPPNIKIIRVMCTSRLNPLFVLKSFQKGADGVLVAGCHLGDCHYISGNMYTRRRMAVMRRLLDFMGIDRSRFRVKWVSASEGARFASVVKEMTEDLRKLGPLKGWRAIKSE